MRLRSAGGKELTYQQVSAVKNRAAQLQSLPYSACRVKLYSGILAVDWLAIWYGFPNSNGAALTAANLDAKDSSAFVKNLL
jgi:hypothetical protein